MKLLVVLILAVQTQGLVDMDAVVLWHDQPRFSKPKPPGLGRSAALGDVLVSLVIHTDSHPTRYWFHPIVG
jgi:hypothetical protein